MIAGKEGTPVPSPFRGTPPTTVLVAGRLKLGVTSPLAPVVNGVSLPLLLLSGVMLPMTLAPDWLQTIAKFNPLYHTVAAMRALFNASYGDGEIVVGLILLVVLTVITFSVGARSFSRAAA